jgi:hypothetical protein
MHVIVLKEDIDYTLNHIKSNLNYTYKLNRDTFHIHYIEAIEKFHTLLF